MAILFLLTLAQLSDQSQIRFDQALANFARVQVHFKQETYSDFFDETVSSGALFIQRPGKMRMVYTKGEQRLLIWDGSLCYEYDELADVESRTPQHQVREEPLVRILLYGEELKQHFLINRRKHEDREVYQLTPRANSDYQVEIELNENGLPASLRVENENGEGTHLSFFNYQLEPDLPMSLFEIPAAKPLQQ